MHLTKEIELLRGSYFVGALVDRFRDVYAYLGHDRFGQEVEIYEYYPQEKCCRAEDGTTVLPASGAQASISEGVAAFTSRFETIGGSSLAALPNLLAVFKENGTVYTIARVRAGDSLLERLANEGKLAPDIVTDLSLRLLDAIGSCHAAGILHCDLSLSAILQSPDGTVALQRLGLPVDSPRNGYQYTEVPLARLDYAPPEAFGDGKAYGPSADLFSIAAILYECACGFPPVNVLDRQRALQEEAPDPHDPLCEMVPDLSRDLASLIDRALSLSPGERPRDVAEWHSVLLKLSDSATAEDGRKPGGKAGLSDENDEVTPPPPPPRKWLRALAALLVLAMISAVAFALSNERQRLGALTALDHLVGPYVSKPPWASTLDRLAATIRQDKLRAAIATSNRSDRIAALQGIIDTYPGESEAREAEALLEQIRILLTVDLAGGADFRSIRAALEAAEPGARIEIAPGTYSERVRVDIPVTIAGTAPGVVIESIDAGTPTMRWTASNGRIEALTILKSGLPDAERRADRTRDSALAIEVGRLELSNVVISAPNGGGAYISNGATLMASRETTFARSHTGLQIAQGALATLRDTLFKENEVGLWATRGNVDVAKSDFEGNRNGLWLTNGAEGRTNVAIRDNNFRRESRCAIVSYSGGARIEGNNFEGGNTGVCVFGGSAEIRENEIFNANFGVRIEDARAEIEQNEISDSASVGVLARQFAQTFAAGNIVTGGRYGFLTEGGATLSLNGDTITGAKETGVLAGCRSNARLVNVTVSGSGAHGVAIGRGASSDINSSRFVANGRHGVLVLGRLTMEGARVERNDRHGVRIMSLRNISDEDANATLSGNAYFCGQTGVLSGSATISKLTAFGNAGFGVNAVSGTTLQLDGSKIFDNGMASTGYPGIGLGLTATATIRNTTTYGNGNFGIWWNEKTSINADIVEKNDWQDGYHIE